MSTESDLCNYVLTSIASVGVSTKVVKQFPESYEGETIPAIYICPVNSERRLLNFCEQYSFDITISVVYINENMLVHLDLSALNIINQITNILIANEVSLPTGCYRMDVEPSESFNKDFLPEGWIHCEQAFNFRMVR